MSSQNKNNLIEFSKFAWDAQRSVPGLKINMHDTASTENDAFSAHGIMTGIVETNANETQVYVKPHANHGRAKREFEAAHSLAKLGLTVPERIGMHVGEEATYVVSKKYPGLRTLIDYDWGVSVADATARRLLIPELGRAAQSAAILHNNGVTHGDFHPKNVAFGPNNEPVFIDLERTNIGSRGKRDAEDRAGDLYALGSGVLVSWPRPKEGLYYDKSPSYRLGAMHELMVNPYAESLLDEQQTDLELVDHALKRALTEHKIIPFGKIVAEMKR